KTSDPRSGSEVRPGDVITYTLTARRAGATAALNARVTDDLSGVLAHANLVPGSIHPAAGSAALDGTKLVWRIPVVDADVRLTYQVTVDPDAWGTTLRNAVTPGPGGIPCDTAHCDATTHPVATEPGPGGGLPETGGTNWWLVPLGLLTTACG